MNVKVYVEGGGNGRELRARCRKGFSSFDLLSQVDPAKVLAASPHARRLVDALREKAS